MRERRRQVREEQDQHERDAEVRARAARGPRLDRGEPVWVNLAQVAALDWLVGQGKSDHTRITFANGSFLTVQERPDVLLAAEMR